MITHTSRPLSRAHLRVVGAVVVLSILPAACREPAPPAPAAPVFRVDEVAGRLAALRLDDAFFRDLDALRDHATSNPAATPTLARLSIETLGAALVSNPSALKPLAGADLGAPAPGVARWLQGLAALPGLDAPTKDALAGLTGAFGGPGPGDLTRTIALAQSNEGIGPGVRLVLSARMIKGLADAVSAPEWERGRVLQAAVPGLPVPPTSSPGATVFPVSLKTLSALLQDAGTGPLAPHFARLASAAAAVLGDRPHALWVAPGADARPGTPVGGLRSAYQPLAALVASRSGVSIAARPAVAWAEGRPVDRTADVGWPGASLVPPSTATGGLPKSHEAAAKALLDAADRLDPIEAAAYAGRVADGVPNASRKAHKSLLVVADAEAETGALRVALAAAVASGRTDLRLVPAGTDGRVLPFAFRKLPVVEGFEAPKGKRLIVALFADHAELFPPAGGRKLPATGWPEGTKPELDGKEFSRLTVPWASGKSFGGALASGLAALRKATDAGPVVEMVVRLKDDQAFIGVVDAVTEVAAVPGDAFAGLASLVPGAACDAAGSCPALLPVVFSDAALPRPAKPDASVKEDARPAGFCEASAVRQVMQGRSGAYRACYETALQRVGDLAGRIELRFTIEPDGSVSGIAVTADDLKNKDVSACLLKQVSGLKFPKPDGGVCVIRWPFKFQPGG